MTLPRAIRLNVEAPWPARVTGGGVVAITKANGIWTVSLDFTSLAQLPAGPLGQSTVLAVEDPATGIFYKVTVGELISLFPSGLWVSQIKQGLASIDTAARPLVAGNIPSSIYNHIRICWDGQLAVVGDALYNFIKQQLFANNDAATLAFYTSCALFPVTPT